MVDPNPEHATADLTAHYASPNTASKCMRPHVTGSLSQLDSSPIVCKVEKNNPCTDFEATSPPQREDETTVEGETARKAAKEDHNSIFVPKDCVDERDEGGQPHREQEQNCGEGEQEREVVEVYGDDEEDVQVDDEEDVDEERVGLYHSGWHYGACRIFRWRDSLELDKRRLEQGKRQHPREIEMCGTEAIVWDVDEERVELNRRRLVGLNRRRRIWDSLEFLKRQAIQNDQVASLLDTQEERRAFNSNQPRGSWMCPVCKMRNLKFCDTCLICETVRFDSNESASGDETEAAARARPTKRRATKTTNSRLSDLEWACSCGQINQSFEPACGACYVMRVKPWGETFTHLSIGAAGHGEMPSSVDAMENDGKPTKKRSRQA